MDTSLYAPLPDFGIPVGAVEIKLSDKKLKSRVQNWIQQQGWHWPKDLTAEKMTENLTLCYMPYWLIQGRASGDWQGEVQHTNTREAISGYSTCTRCQGQGQVPHPAYGYSAMNRCVSCGGRGVTTSTFMETTIDWKSKSGRVNTDVSIRLPNVDPSFGTILLWVPEINTKKLSVSRPEVPIVRTDDRDKYDLTTIKNTGIQNGLIEKVQENHGTGNTRNVTVNNISDEKVTVSTILYPVYAGILEYGGEKLAIQVNAATGYVASDIPAIVKKKRQRDQKFLRIATYIAGAILLILLFKPLGIGSFLPTCSRLSAACREPQTFYAFGMLAVIFGYLARKIVRNFIDPNTPRERIILGLVVSIPVIFLCFFGPFSIMGLSTIQSAVFVIIAFAVGAAGNLGISILFVVLLMLNLSSLKLADMIAVPIIVFACLWLIVLPEFKK